MRNVLFIITVLLPFLAFGDARIEEGGAICHFPYLNTDTDVEFKAIGNCAGGIVPMDDGSIIGIASVEMTVPGPIAVIRLLPVELRNDFFDHWITSEDPYIIRTNGPYSGGTTCAIVESGDNQIDAWHWHATIQITKLSAVSAQLLYQLECFDS